MENRKALLLKLAKLQEVMGNFSWEKDGINRAQSYKYITEKQYKANFQQALKEAELLWKMEIINREYIPNITEKQHMIVCDFEGRLIDPDTGAEEVYRFSGTGADVGDKALYKAVTGGHKFFLAANYNISADIDPERADEAKTSKRPVDPIERESIKEEVLGKKDQANAMMVTTLKGALKELQEIDPSQVAFIEKVITNTERFTKLNKTACEKLILKVNDMVKKAKENI